MKWRPKRPARVVRSITPTTSPILPPESPVDETEELESVETPEKLENSSAATTAPNMAISSSVTSDNETAKNDDLGSVAETPGTTPELGEDQKPGDRKGQGMRVDGRGKSEEVRKDGPHRGPHQPKGSSHAR